MNTPPMFYNLDIDMLAYILELKLIPLQIKTVNTHAKKVKTAMCTHKQLQTVY